MAMEFSLCLKNVSVLKLLTFDTFPDGQSWVLTLNNFWRITEEYIYSKKTLSNTKYMPWLFK